MNGPAIASPESAKLMSDEEGLGRVPDAVRTVPEILYEEFGFDMVAVAVASAAPSEAVTAITLFPSTSGMPADHSFFQTTPRNSVTC